MADGLNLTRPVSLVGLGGAADLSILVQPKARKFAPGARRPTAKPSIPAPAALVSAAPPSAAPASAAPGSAAPASAAPASAAPARAASAAGTDCTAASRAVVSTADNLTSSEVPGQLPASLDTSANNSTASQHIQETIRAESAFKHTNNDDGHQGGELQKNTLTEPSICGLQAGSGVGATLLPCFGSSLAAGGSRTIAPKPRKFAPGRAPAAGEPALPTPITVMPAGAGTLSVAATAAAAAPGAAAATGENASSGATAAKGATASIGAIAAAGATTATAAAGATTATAAAGVMIATAAAGATAAAAAARAVPTASSLLTSVAMGLLSTAAAGIPVVPRLRKFAPGARKPAGAPPKGSDLQPQPAAPAAACLEQGVAGSLQPLPTSQQAPSQPHAFLPSWQTFPLPVQPSPASGPALSEPNATMLTAQLLASIAPPSQSSPDNTEMAQPFGHNPDLGNASTGPLAAAAIATPGFQASDTRSAGMSTEGPSRVANMAHQTQSQQGQTLKQLQILGEQTLQTSSSPAAGPAGPSPTPAVSSATSILTSVVPNLLGTAVGGFEVVPCVHKFASGAHKPFAAAPPKRSEPQPQAAPPAAASFTAGVAGSTQPLTTSQPAPSQPYASLPSLQAPPLPAEPSLVPAVAPYQPNAAMRTQSTAQLPAATAAPSQSSPDKAEVAQPLRGASDLGVLIPGATDLLSGAAVAPCVRKFAPGVRKPAAVAAAPLKHSDPQPQVAAPAAVAHTAGLAGSPQPLPTSQPAHFQPHASLPSLQAPSSPPEISSVSAAAPPQPSANMLTQSAAQVSAATAPPSQGSPGKAEMAQPSTGTDLGILIPGAADLLGGAVAVVGRMRKFARDVHKPAAAAAAPLKHSEPQPQVAAPAAAVHTAAINGSPQRLPTSQPALSLPHDSLAALQTPSLPSDPSPVPAVAPPQPSAALPIQLVAQVSAATAPPSQSSPDRTETAQPVRCTSDLGMMIPDATDLLGVVLVSPLPEFAPGVRKPAAAAAPPPKHSEPQAAARAAAAQTAGVAGSPQPLPTSHPALSQSHAFLPSVQTPSSPREISSVPATTPSQPSANLPIQSTAQVSTATAPPSQSPDKTKHVQPSRGRSNLGVFIPGAADLLSAAVVPPRMRKFAPGVHKPAAAAAPPKHLEPQQRALSPSAAALTAVIAELPQPLPTSQLASSQPHASLPSWQTPALSPDPFPVSAAAPSQLNIALPTQPATQLSAASAMPSQSGLDQTQGAQPSQPTSDLGVLIPRATDLLSVAAVAAPRVRKFAPGALPATTTARPSQPNSSYAAQTAHSTAIPPPSALNALSGPTPSTRAHALPAPVIPWSNPHPPGPGLNLPSTSSHQAHTDMLPGTLDSNSPSRPSSPHIVFDPTIHPQHSPSVPPSIPVPQPTYPHPIDPNVESCWQTLLSKLHEHVTGGASNRSTQKRARNKEALQLEGVNAAGDAPQAGDKKAPNKAPKKTDSGESVDGAGKGAAGQKVGKEKGKAAAMGKKRKMWEGGADGTEGTATLGSVDASTGNHPKRPPSSAQLLSETVDETWTLSRIISRTHALERHRQVQLKEQGEADKDKNKADAPALLPARAAPLPAAIATLAPRLKLDANGQLVLDQDSLEVQAQEDNMAGYVRVHEERRLINSFTYMERRAAKRWTPEETDLFYKALVHFGHDLTVISQYMNRDRASLKAKYKREQATNSHRVQAALRRHSEEGARNFSKTRQMYLEVKQKLPAIEATPLPSLPAAPRGSAEKEWPEEDQQGKQGGDDMQTAQEGKQEADGLQQQGCEEELVGMAEEGEGCGVEDVGYEGQYEDEYDAYAEDIYY